MLAKADDDDDDDDGMFFRSEMRTPSPCIVGKYISFYRDLSNLHFTSAKRPLIFNRNLQSIFDRSLLLNLRAFN